MAQSPNINEIVLEIVPESIFYDLISLHVGKNY